jgi:hypothetical protein
LLKCARSAAESDGVIGRLDPGESELFRTNERWVRVTPNAVGKESGIADVEGSSSGSCFDEPIPPRAKPENEDFGWSSSCFDEPIPLRAKPENADFGSSSSCFDEPIPLRVKPENADFGSSSSFC